MMVVTHEIGFAREVADRVIFMDGGVIVEDRAAARRVPDTVPGAHAKLSKGECCQKKPYR